MNLLLKIEQLVQMCSFTQLVSGYRLFDNNLAIIESNYTESVSMNRPPVQTSKLLK